jgi:Fe-S cluster assembly ATP-binding protein
MVQPTNTNSTPLLEVRDLRVSAGEVEILKGINLVVNPGEVHAIMGPNGSGKSTLSGVLAGRPEYTVTHGQVRYQGQDLLKMPPELRAREGIFLAFQYPVELPGVRNFEFVRTALNAQRTHRGLEEMDIRSFDKLFQEKILETEIDPSLMKRSVNDGFSGGEKKRSEILQMAILEPKLALLDETDSGLDIDALKTVAQGINRLRSPDRAVVLVTHYQRILSLVTPDHVHVLVDGRIVMSGGDELAHELESRGYDWVRDSTSNGAEVGA